MDWEAFQRRGGSLLASRAEARTAVYLACDYALSRSRDCAIDDRFGAEAPARPMHRTSPLGPNDRRCNAPEWMLKPYEG